MTQKSPVLLNKDIEREIEKAWKFQPYRITFQGPSIDRYANKLQYECLNCNHKMQKTFAELEDMWAKGYYCPECFGSVNPIYEEHIPEELEETNDEYIGDLSAEYSIMLGIEEHLGYQPYNFISINSGKSVRLQHKLCNTIFNATPSMIYPMVKIKDPFNGEDLTVPYCPKCNQIMIDEQQNYGAIRFIERLDNHFKHGNTDFPYEFDQSDVFRFKDLNEKFVITCKYCKNKFTDFPGNLFTNDFSSKCPICHGTPVKTDSGERAIQEVENENARKKLEQDILKEEKVQPEEVIQTPTEEVIEETSNVNQNEEMFVDEIDKPISSLENKSSKIDEEKLLEDMNVLNSRLYETLTRAESLDSVGLEIFDDVNLYEDLSIPELSIQTKVIMLVNLKKAIRLLIDKANEYANDLTGIRKELSKISNDLNEKIFKVEKLEKEVSDKDDEIKSLNEKLSKSEFELETINGKYDSLKNEYKELELNNSKLNSDLEELRLKNEELINSKKETESEFIKDDPESEESRIDITSESVEEKEPEIIRVYRDSLFTILKDTRFSTDAKRKCAIDYLENIGKSRRLSNVEKYEKSAKIISGFIKDGAIIKSDNKLLDEKLRKLYLISDSVEGILDVENESVEEQTSEKMSSTKLEDVNLESVMSAKDEATQVQEQEEIDDAEKYFFDESDDACAIGESVESSVKPIQSSDEIEAVEADVESMIEERQVYQEEPVVESDMSNVDMSGYPEVYEPTEAEPYQPDYLNPEMVHNEENDSLVSEPVPTEETEEEIAQSMNEIFEDLGMERDVGQNSNDDIVVTESSEEDNLYDEDGIPYEEPEDHNADESNDTNIIPEPQIQSFDPNQSGFPIDVLPNEAPIFDANFGLNSQSQTQSRVDIINQNQQKPSVGFDDFDIVDDDLM